MSRSSESFDKLAVEERSTFARWQLGALLACLLIILEAGVPVASAEYFPKESFQPYRANGIYPSMSRSWVKFDHHVYLDAQGIPYVEYPTGKSYNVTTISLFGLYAYDAYLEQGGPEEKAEFLRLAEWVAKRQDANTGCWCHDFDLEYKPLGETIHRPWASAMTQGLGISLMTRAFAATGDAQYKIVAERALLPFCKEVGEGGVAREFTLPGEEPNSDRLSFFEEYPVQPAPAYTLNGFMYALLGLYDLGQMPNAEAAALFESGMRTLRMALPLYDLGDGSAYDLVHLTKPPRPIHSDTSYHLLHIALLNALGSATRDDELLWYRDHWNAYGTRMDRGMVWLQHFAIWLVYRQTILVAVSVFLALLGFVVSARSAWRRWRRKKPAPAPMAGEMRLQNQGLSNV